MFTPKGKFGWYELMTSDTKAAGKFYSDVVGWTTHEMSGGGQQYTTFNLGEVGMAGPRLGQHFRRLPRRWGHLFFPARPLGVGDLDGDG